MNKKLNDIFISHDGCANIIVTEKDGTERERYHLIKMESEEALIKHLKEKFINEDVIINGQQKNTTCDNFDDFIKTHWNKSIGTISDS